jgi:hypothetical protein
MVVNRQQNGLKNHVQPQGLQNDKCDKSNVKFTNPEEAANLYVHHKSQPTTM